MKDSAKCWVIGCMCETSGPYDDSICVLVCFEWIMAARASGTSASPMGFKKSRKGSRMQKVHLKV